MARKRRKTNRHKITEEYLTGPDEGEQPRRKRKKSWCSKLKSKFKLRKKPKKKVSFNNQVFVRLALKLIFQLLLITAFNLFCYTYLNKWYTMEYLGKLLLAIYFVHAAKTEVVVFAKVRRAKFGILKPLFYKAVIAGTVAIVNELSKELYSKSLFVEVKTYTITATLAILVYIVAVIKFTSTWLPKDNKSRFINLKR